MVVRSEINSFFHSAARCPLLRSLFIPAASVSQLLDPFLPKPLCGITVKSFGVEAYVRLGSVTY